MPRNRSQKLHTWFSRQLESFLESLDALVATPTPTLDRSRLQTFAEKYQRLLAQVCSDVKMEQTEAGPLLWARRPGTGPHVLILLHMDTVWPVDATGVPPHRREGNILRGPGAFDMKSNLVMALYSLKAADALNLDLPAITILATPDEESGSIHSRQAIEATAEDADIVLVPESPLPGGDIKFRRKGVAVYTVTAHGKAAHAGINPQDGINAVHEIAHVISAIAALSDPDNGLTVNVNTLKGGVARNAIPHTAVATVDARGSSAETLERLTEKIHALRPTLRNARLTVEGGINRPPLEPVAGSDELADMAVEIGAEVGLTLKKAGTGGGSDGSFTAAIGKPTLDGIGIDGSGAHTEDEHILIDRIAPRCALFTELMLRWKNR